MSKLIDRLAQAKPNGAPGPGSALAKILAGSVRGEHVTLPVVGRAWIELAGHETVNEIEGDTYNEMRRLGFELAPSTAETFAAERAMRTLAACVRDPDDRTKPLGSVEDWCKVDSDLINACYLAYADVRDRLDPIGAPSLNEETAHLIELAIKKKQASTLRAFGVATLANYLLTTGDRPAISQSPPSSSGDVSPES